MQDGSIWDVTYCLVMERVWQRRNLSTLFLTLFFQSICCMSLSETGRWARWTFGLTLYGSSFILHSHPGPSCSSIHVCTCCSLLPPTLLLQPPSASYSGLQSCMKIPVLSPFAAHLASFCPSLETSPLHTCRMTPVDFCGNYNICLKGSCEG